jgi:nitrite reductase/ring-hydroxylating ferredoxin subunit
MQASLAKIPLQRIRKDSLNRFTVEGGLTILVFYDGARYEAVSDVCPHMGGPLSQGSYCARARTITCPWHGYVYSAETLALAENPNEKIWIEPFAGPDAAAFRTPAYRLRRLAARAEGDHLLVEG